MSTRYYTLLCSLPHLPHFQKAKHLPLTPVLLEKRLGLLPETEWALCGLMLKSLPWHHTSRHESGETVAGEYGRLMALAESYPDLQRFFTTMMEQRIVVAWQRSRFFEIAGAWELGSLEGIASLEPFIERLEKANPAWLAHRFPWLKEMVHCLDGDRPYELSVMLMELEWREAERLAFSHPFGFEEVAAYLIRWMLLQTWFGFDAQKAASRFITLTSEIVSDYRHDYPLFD